MFKVLISILMCISACKSQSLCSDSFNYVKDDGEQQGLITFENPEQTAEINLKIQLSIAVPLPSVSGITTNFNSFCNSNVLFVVLFNKNK